MSEAVAAPARFRFIDWLREGLRSALLLRSRLDGREAGPGPLIGVVVLYLLLRVGLERLTIAGPATFDFHALLVPHWSTAVSVLVVWAALRNLAAPGRPRHVATWFTLEYAASLPLLVVGGGMGIVQARGLDWLASSTPLLIALGVAGFVVLAWSLLVTLWIGIQFGLRRWRLAGVVLASAALMAVLAWQFQDPLWEPVVADDEVRRPRLELSQQAFEDQQDVTRRTFEAVAPQREGIADVYGLVFAPYAAEDVFLRESAMVAGVLEERFDAKGRVVRLMNHATTTATLPWATPVNLKRAVAAIAAKMDRDNDVLVVYLTSHGGGNFHLSSSHWPLEVKDLTPRDLREALDEAGVKHRVIAVSACYSGGWVGPLANEDTLVMTAADATHTSYGCGRRSPLTFFGRAVFDEQLRQTRSFEQAFAAAVPVIQQREVEAKKKDGFSNPQISVGAKVKPVLDAIAQRLDSPR